MITTCQSIYESWALMCGDGERRRGYEIILKEGKGFTAVDAAKSYILARIIHAQPRCCFHNCQMALKRDPGLTYYEGFAFSVIPMEHAWLVNNNGEVIDPTWVPMEVHEDWDHVDYFGVALPRDFINERIRTRRSTVPLLSEWIKLKMRDATFKPVATSF